MEQPEPGASDYDVAIVGTGPGGGAAAIALAQSGLRVVVVEKEKLPRAKACGGAMPGQIQTAMDFSIAPLIEARIKHQQFCYDHSAEMRQTLMSDPMILVDRATFDLALIKEAMGRPGARIELRDGWAVEDAAEDAEGVTLYSKAGAKLRCRYVIAADGATSRVARACGLYDKAQGAGVDAHVRVTPQVFETERARVTFNLHCVAAGYGWVFPKGDHLSCGVGMWRNPKRLLPQLEDFLARTFPKDSILEIERLSHPVPVFQGHKSVATSRVCLVGDAAHMVDPILGEGIKYALEAGQLAAHVITHLCRPEADGPKVETGTRALEDLLRDYGDCRVYSEIVRYTVGRKLNIIRLTEDGFFTNPEGVYNSVMA